jgi:hypothetical protein
MRLPGIQSTEYRSFLWPARKGRRPPVVLTAKLVNTASFPIMLGNRLLFINVRGVHKKLDTSTDVTGYTANDSVESSGGSLEDGLNVSGAIMSEFKGRHFEGEVIPWAVRWYCRYGISYRDLEQMLDERGVPVDHSTISRWVQKYAPEIEKRLRCSGVARDQQAGGSMRLT